MIDFGERFNYLLSDWTEYNHECLECMEESKHMIELWGDTQPDLALHLFGSTAAFILSNEIMKILNRINTNCWRLEDPRSFITEGLKSLFNNVNDQYLDYIIDYNLVEDEMTKAEMGSCIEVLKTAIRYINNMNVMGE